MDIPIQQHFSYKKTLQKDIFDRNLVTFKYKQARPYTHY
jgi:hypothetical protein